MSENSYDSLYTAWATIAGGTGYDSTYSAMKAALDKIDGDKTYDSVYDIASNLAEGVESGEVGISKGTQLDVSIEENGSYTYTPDEGFMYDSVTVSVDAGSKAEGTIKIVNNGTYDVTSYAQANVAVGGESKPQIPNGFRFTGGDLALVDFGAYDWSMVYDTSSFFQGCTHSTGDWSNFEENFNGKIVDGNQMFYNMGYITSAPSMDTSKMYNATEMFYACYKLETVPDMDLSSVCGGDLTFDSVECGNMFRGCTKLKSVGKLTTPNTRVFSNMFNGCTSLTYIPDMDFDSVMRMVGMFSDCPIVGDYVIDARNCVSLYDAFCFTSSNSKYKGDLNLSLKVCNDPNSPNYILTTTLNPPPKYVQMYRAFENNANLKTLELDGYIGGSLTRCFFNCSNLESLSFNCDFSNVTNVTLLFQKCTKLESIPDMNLSSVTTFRGDTVAYSWLLYCSSLKSIGVIDCDSCTQAAYLVPSSTVLTDLGGFRNLGKASTISGTDGDNFLYQTPNLTYESLMNVINMLYDRASNGLSTVTIKLHTNHMALLSEEDIAIATNKGWILTA
jgi:hypothetical protein